MRPSRPAVPGAPDSGLGVSTPSRVGMWQSPVAEAAGEGTVPGEWLPQLQGHLLIQGWAVLGAGK